MPIEILRRRVVSSSAAGKVNKSYLLVMFVSGKFVFCVRDARPHHAGRWQEIRPRRIVAQMQHFFEIASGLSGFIIVTAGPW
jgi:hypothetical protein